MTTFRITSAEVTASPFGVKVRYFNMLGKTINEVDYLTPAEAENEIKALEWAQDSSITIV